MSNNEDLIFRTEEDQKRSIDLFDKFRDDLLKRQLSNTENYDKSILTLSSSGLAISLTFISSVVKLESAKYLWLIKMSWILFFITIAASLLAYLISNAAIRRQLEIAEDYYINKKQSALTQKNNLSILNDSLNCAVGLIFIVAILSVVFFITLNLTQGKANMSDKEVKTSNSVPAFDSATIPSMQKVPAGNISINSAQIPTMQSAPSTTSQQTQQTQSSQSQAPKSSEK